nr:hypothetical protein GCM10020185_45350 [Pseudomonas brassicacearum subsp. brassicacearum]
MAFARVSAKLQWLSFLSPWLEYKKNEKNNNSLLRHLPWLLLAVVGACALGVVALRRGEAINALWIVVAAVAIYLVAYRYYSLFIANNVMQLDARRATPAVLNNDGLDYVPTNKHILFRPPLRGHCRRGAAGRAGAGGADGLPARYALADRRRGVGRCGAGLHGPVPVHPPQRAFPG